MANEQNSSGIPAPTTEGSQPSKEGSVIKTDGQTIQAPPNRERSTSERDNLIADGILIALIIAFFFVKNAFADSLVAKRVSPSKANIAGWGLFVFLTSAAIAGVLTVTNFISLLFTLPLAIAAFVGLFIAYTNSRN